MICVKLATWLLAIPGGGNGRAAEISRGAFREALRPRRLFCHIVNALMAASGRTLVFQCGLSGRIATMAENGHGFVVRSVGKGLAFFTAAAVALLVGNVCS
ncbi:MAG: hypothetical protein ABIJ50_03435 [Pseudomonadota bacterium]